MCQEQIKKILIVEDDPDISFALGDFLEGEGYRVASAENGRLALDILRETSTPNLILLDLKMPIMSGPEFSEAYHSSYKDRAPIIVMSADADARRKARGIQASDWIEKPFALSRLLSIIKQYEL